MRQSASILAAAMLVSAAFSATSAATELQDGVHEAQGRFVRGAFGLAQPDAGAWSEGSAAAAATPDPAPAAATLAPQGTGPGSGLLYFTPGLGGVRGGVGIATVPDRRDPGRIAPITEPSRSVSVGATYGADVGGGLRLWGGSGYSNVTTSSPAGGDAGAMRLGGGLGWGSLKLGGYFETARGDLPNDGLMRQRGFDVGASYEVGDFRTGLTWSRGIYRDIASSGRTGINDELSLSLSYRLRDNIDLMGSLQYDAGDKTGVAPRTDNSSAFVFGTAIRF